MAILKIWTIHKSQREIVLGCTGGVQISNDGTVNITIPKKLALLLGFSKIENRRSKRNRMDEEIQNLINWCEPVEPSDICDVMEWLNDSGYLSEQGKIFYNDFWEKKIKE